VPAVHYKEARSDAQGATSAEIRERVSSVRASQQAHGHYNSQLPPRILRRLCRLDDAGERTLETAMRRLGLSARAPNWRAREMLL
jgi:magnesium chelatase family protein